MWRPWHCPFSPMALNLSSLTYQASTSTSTNKRRRRKKERRRRRRRSMKMIWRRRIQSSKWLFLSPNSKYVSSGRSSRLIILSFLSLSGFLLQLSLILIVMFAQMETVTVDRAHLLISGAAEFLLLLHFFSTMSSSRLLLLPTCTSPPPCFGSLLHHLSL